MDEGGDRVVQGVAGDERDGLHADEGLLPQEEQEPVKGIYLGSIE